MTKDVFLSKVKTSILSFDQNAQVILFGSRARGDSKVDSDWDFLIITSAPIDEKNKVEMQKKLYSTELETEEVISPIIYFKEDWDDLSITPLYQIIQEEGIKI